MCVNETSMLPMSDLEYEGNMWEDIPGVCMTRAGLICSDDDDCDTGLSCEEVPLDMIDTSVGNMVCTPTEDFDACTVTGDDTDCDDDQQCVDGQCLGLCDTDYDCEGTTPCEDFTGFTDVASDIKIPGGFFDNPLEETVLFSYCNILYNTPSPTPVPTTVIVEETTEDLGDSGDGAFEQTVFCAVAVAITAYLF